MNHGVTAEMLSLVLERLGDGIILVDRDGCCLYVNPEALRLFGRAREELIGRRIRDAMPDVVANLSEGARERLLAGEEVMLLRSYFAQGRWFEVLGRPLAGNFLIHFHDITERLQAESARRQSEERFRILVDGVRDYALIMIDPKGQIASWNAGAERLLGYSAAEAQGKPLAFLFPPELVRLDVPRQRLEETVRRGRLRVERQASRKDGSHFLAQGTYTALLDDLQAPSGFALIIHDVTAQRALEESLRTNEERLRLALEAGAIGTWEEIVGERRIIANRYFFALSGLPLDREPSMDDFLSIVHPDDRAYFERRRQEILDGEVGREFEFEYRLTNRDGGKPRWVEVHGSSYRSGTEPGPRRFMGVLRDTTKRHQLDEYRELAAGIIAHDLRSPLASIRLTSQVLIEREALPPGASEKVQSIVRKVDRMAKMIEGLLIYTQAQFGGGLKLDEGFTDLEQVCRDAIADLSARREGGILFTAEGDCHGVWDRTRLVEVVSNLVVNALQYGQAGCPVDVFALGRGDQVLLQVHNLGPPIGADQLSAIFEPFHRAGNRRRSGEEGFGLGLYIVREIVAAHGGTIEVSSSVESGTTFTVRLPRGSASTPQLHHPDPS